MKRMFLQTIIVVLLLCSCSSADIALTIPVAKTAMSIAWGDAWTNMIQPFWALPALGIAGLGAKDIMGYCLIDLLYSGVIIGLGLMFIGM